MLEFGAVDQPLVISFNFLSQPEPASSTISWVSAGPRAVDVTLVNFNNPLGVGPKDPIRIGSIGQKGVYLQIRVYGLADDDRTLAYTMYAMTEGSSK